MPTIFRFGRYVIYFWSNEGLPPEPVHVHVAVGNPAVNDAKLWITSSGEVIICHNNARIPEKMLRRIMRAVEQSVEDITEE